MQIKVKTKVDNLTIGNRTLAKGEVAYCPVDRVQYLVDLRKIEVIDPTPVKDVDAKAMSVSVEGAGGGAP